MRIIFNSIGHVTYIYLSKSPKSMLGAGIQSWDQALLCMTVLTYVKLPHIWSHGWHWLFSGLSTTVVHWHSRARYQRWSSQSWVSAPPCSDCVMTGSKFTSKLQELQLDPGETYTIGLMKGCNWFSDTVKTVLVIIMQRHWESNTWQMVRANANFTHTVTVFFF